MDRRSILWALLLALLAGACTSSTAHQRDNSEPPVVVATTTARVHEVTVSAAIPAPTHTVPAFDSPGDAAVAAARTLDPTLTSLQVTNMVAIYADETTVDLRVRVETDEFCQWFGVAGQVAGRRLVWRASPALSCAE